MSTEGSRRVFKLIKVLFDTQIYEENQQLCWDNTSYKSQIAIMTEVLRLQQERQLPSSVTAEDIGDLLVEESRSSQRMQLWEYNMERLEKDVARPLLQLVWRVNTSLKMRDTEFEARRLLSSPETIPPLFQHPKITNQAHKYARMLTERQQEAPRSKLLGPRDVVIEVVPKVVQNFWLPPPTTSVNMPSKQLSEVTVGLTKAVEAQVSIVLSSMLCEVTFSRSIRDNMVRSIMEKITQDYTQNVLKRKLKSFSSDLLKNIYDVAAGEICELFQPHIGTEPADGADGAEAITSPDEGEEPGVTEDIKTHSVVTSPAPPANIVLEQTPSGPDPESSVVNTSKGIYKPIRVLFGTPIYEKALEFCWFIGSYKTQIAIMTEVLRLQQERQLPSSVTAEDIGDLLVEEGRSTLRVQIWEFDLEGFDNDDARPLLQLVWRVNTSLKMRDTEFEARRLLSSPETIPPLFQHPTITNQAHKYARMLTERQQEAPRSKLLGPRDIVIEVVPKVVQNFWLPPPTTSFNMPSKQLSVVTVGLTKAVEDKVSTALSSMLCEVTFSRSIRDNMVRSIMEKIKLGYSQNILTRKLKYFSKDVLKNISDVAAGEICELFQPHIDTEPADGADGAEAITSPDEGEEPGVTEDIKTHSVVTPPSPSLTHFDDGLEPTTPSPDPESAVVTAPSPPETPIDVGLEQTPPSPDSESAVVTAPSPPVTPIEVDLEQTPPSPDYESAVVTAPSPPLTHFDDGLEQTPPTPYPESAVVTPPSPPETPIDVGLEQTPPTPYPESAVVTPPSPHLTHFDNGLEQTPPSPDYESAVVTAPSPPLTHFDDGLEQTPPTPYPESAVVTPPSPPETPIDVGLELTPPSPDSESAVVTPPSPPLTHIDFDLEQTPPSPDSESAVVTPPSPPVTQIDVDLEQTPPSPDSESAVVTAPSPPVTQVDVGLELTPPSPEPEPAVVTPPSPPLTQVDDGLELTPPSPEPEPAVVTPPSPHLTHINVGLELTPPSPYPESAVVTAPSPPVTPIEVDLEQTPPSPDSESAVVTAPSPPVTQIDGGLEQTPTSPDPESALVTHPPPPLTPTSEAEVMASVQDEQIITGQPVSMEESFNTTTELQKAKMSGFRKFFSRLKKVFCCCFLPEDDTE